MEVTFAEEYSAIHKGLLHYLGLINFLKKKGAFSSSLIYLSSIFSMQANL